VNPSQISVANLKYSQIFETLSGDWRASRYNAGVATRAGVRNAVLFQIGRTHSARVPARIMTGYGTVECAFLIEDQLVTHEIIGQYKFIV
jgi:hypothetical protein